MSTAPNRNSEADLREESIRLEKGVQPRVPSHIFPGELYVE